MINSGSSKRGNIILEAIFILILLFVFALIMGVMYKNLSDITPDIVDDVTATESKEIMQETNDRYPNVFTGLFMIIFMGLWLFTIIAAYYSDEHPFLFIVTMFLLVVFLILSGYIGNAYEDLFNDAEYTGLSTAMPIPHFIMTHLIQVNLGIMATALLIAFLRGKFSD